jgi:hypothetical protein
MTKKIDLTRYNTKSHNVLIPETISPGQVVMVESTNKKTKIKGKIGRPTICEVPGTKQISLKLTENEYEILKKKASGVPLANYVRQLIQKNLGL